MSWIDDLPEVLTWSEKPNLEVGDQIVFAWRNLRHGPADLEWAERHRGEDGVKVPTETTSRVAAEWLEITHIGRHKRGHWFAKFIVRGADKVEFLAPGSGTTTNPARSVDPDAPVLRLVAADARGNEDYQHRQRLVAVKKRLLENLVVATVPAEKIRLNLAIQETERQIKKADKALEKVAA